jgi:N-acyl-D-aspartate/D-glutamate deacylase
MSREFDIAIRKARLRRNGDRLIEIGIRDGHIVAITESLDAEATTEIDARGNLVTSPTLIRTFTSARCGRFL